MWSSYTGDKRGPLTPGTKCGSLTPGINVVLLHQGEMWFSYTREKCGPLTPGINVVLLNQG